MYKLMKKGREEKTKFSKLLPNNQIITACRIELRVHEMTMNEKLTMIGLTEFPIIYKPGFYMRGTSFMNEFKVNWKLNMK